MSKKSIQNNQFEHNITKVESLLWSPTPFAQKLITNYEQNIPAIYSGVMFRKWTFALKEK